MTAPTLTEFLLARIAEDEGQHIPSGRCTCDRYMDGGEPVYHMPQCEVRLVRDAEAKRRIVNLHLKGEAWCDHCDGFGGPDSCDTCPTIQMLALPYADHPDYRQEWKP